MALSTERPSSPAHDHARQPGGIRPDRGLSDIVIRGAREHNLQNLTLRIPRQTLTVVTGVSGSGKSSLVNDILHRALAKHFFNAGDKPGEHEKLTGLEHLDKVIAIDQSDVFHLGTDFHHQRRALHFQILDHRDGIAILQGIAVGIAKDFCLVTALLGCRLRPFVRALGADEIRAVFVGVFGIALGAVRKRAHGGP